MSTRKRLALAILPITMAILACTCNSQGFLPTVATPTMVVSQRTPEPVILVATPTPLPEETIVEVDTEDALLVNLYQRTNPAVVYIQVLVDDGGTLTPLGTGSGFVVDTQGHIVTNSHVVEEADVVTVTFS
jgi:S1-C subfamily serine protease